MTAPARPPAPPVDRSGRRRWRRILHWQRQAARELQRLGAGHDELQALDRLVDELRARAA